MVGIEPATGVLVQFRGLLGFFRRSGLRFRFLASQFVDHRLNDRWIRGLNGVLGFVFHATPFNGDSRGGRFRVDQGLFVYA